MTNDDTMSTARRQAIVDLLGEIARLEDRAQDHEDRERIGPAAKLRGKVANLRVELEALKNRDD